MLIGIDGCCKWGGTPQCVSGGVACVEYDAGAQGVEIKFSVEAESTSQRGEMQGLICALRALAEAPQEEEAIIITDSEYLFNSVSKDWVTKWADNNWVGATGNKVKNIDLWDTVLSLLNVLGRERVTMQWTKGHLVSGITPTMVRHAMARDNTGLELLSNITALIERRSECDRIVNEFNEHRARNGHMGVPAEIAKQWTAMNVFADLSADYIKRILIETGKF